MQAATVNQEHAASARRDALVEKTAQLALRRVRGQPVKISRGFGAHAPCSKLGELSSTDTVRASLDAVAIAVYCKAAGRAAGRDYRPRVRSLGRCAVAVAERGRVGNLVQEQIRFMGAGVIPLFSHRVSHPTQMYRLASASPRNCLAAWLRSPGWATSWVLAPNATTAANAPEPATRLRLLDAVLRWMP